MDELNEIRLRYPSDIVPAEVVPLRHREKTPDQFVDAWGCHWKTLPNGVEHLPTAPLAETSKIASYQLPTDLLEPSRFHRISAACQKTSRFVLGWSEVRPFDRLRFLRGNETALHDLARHLKATRSLLAMLHDAACKELELWAATEVDGVVLRDDLATADGLKMPAAMWCDVFRPFYCDYCRILHAHDKFVFLQSGGDLSEILGDLVQLGVDAVQGDLQVMNVERLAKRYRGHITFWGGVARPMLRGEATVDDLREAVLRVRRALDFGSGGLIAQCQWETGVRLLPTVHFFEQWLAPLPMRT